MQSEAPEWFLEQHGSVESALLAADLAVVNIEAEVGAAHRVLRADDGLGPMTYYSCNGCDGWWSPLELKRPQQPQRQDCEPGRVSPDA